MAPPPDHVSTSASESVPLKVRKVKQIPRYTYLDKQSLNSNVIYYFFVETEMLQCYLLENSISSVSFFFQFANYIRWMDTLI